MKSKQIIIYFFILLTISSCGVKLSGKKPATSHAIWNRLLQKHVAPDGLVNYKGFIADKDSLNIYLNALSAGAPTKQASKNEKLAYWLNVYNAFTIKLIIDHYPLKSIKDIGPANQVIFINTPWDKKFFKIGTRTMTLNTLEHRIIRNQFHDPRIHFALNCASMSCPVLRPESYEASKLNEQLDEQAKLFVNDTTRNKITPNKAEISSIFKWYGRDFRKWGKTTVSKYLNKYSNTPITNNTNIDYLTYNWQLNEAQ
jgi:hypothetical protein